MNSNETVDIPILIVGHYQARSDPHSLHFIAGWCGACRPRPRARARAERHQRAYHRQGTVLPSWPARRRYTGILPSIAASHYVHSTLPLLASHPRNFQLPQSSRRRPCQSDRRAERTSCVQAARWHGAPEDGQYAPTRRPNALDTDRALDPSSCIRMCCKSLTVQPRNEVERSSSSPGEH